MTGMVSYTAKRGVELLGTEALASLIDTVAETLGVDETTEHILNGVDPTTTTNWTAAANTTLSAVSNRLRVTADANGSCHAYQGITTVVGQTYVVNLDFDTAAVTGEAILLVGTTISNYDNYYYYIGFATGSYSFIFKATATTTYLKLFSHSGTLAGEYTEWNNISIKKTGNLVENHHFADSVNSQWTDNSTGTGASVVGGGELTLTSGAPYASNRGVAYQAIALTVGKTYVVSIENTSANTGRMSISSGNVSTRDVAANSTYVFTFTAATAAPELTFYSPLTDSLSWTVDNISIREGVPDLSSLNKAIEVHGQITKSAVATGADLVGYTGFNTYNKLIQPYNSNLNSGTNGFSMRIWYKTNSGLANNESFIERIDPDNTSNPFIIFKMISGGTLQANVNDGTTGRQASSSEEFDDDDPHCGIVTFDGTTIRLYNDKSLIATATGAVMNSLNNTGAKIYIGTNYTGGEAAGESLLAIPVFSTGVVWTEEQIASMYDNEKHLFLQDAAFAIKDQEYSLHLDLDDHKRSVQEITRTNKSHNGSLEKIHIRDDVIHSLTIGATHKSNLPAFREFFYSTREGEEFSLDPYAPENGVDDPITVERISRSNSESRLTNLNHFNTNLQAKEV